MTAKKQEKNLARVENGIIRLQGLAYTIDEAKALVRDLQKLIKNCNVATPIDITPMSQSLFDSINNPEVLTIRISSDNEYNDIRLALKPQKDSLLSLLDKLMEYYSDKESLNIIIAHHVLRNHNLPSLLKHAAQFTQQVSAKTQEFLKVKILHRAKEQEMGVFCRKTDFDLSVTFFGQLVQNLEINQLAYALFDNMPDTYQNFPSMLHFKLKKKLPEVKMQKLAKGLRFYFKK